MLRNLLGTALAVAVLAGCGSLDTRPTVEQLTNARVAVEAAEKADAKTHSPEELRQAQDALAIARDAYANKIFDRTFQFAKKATIYARVAKARTDQKTAENKLGSLKTQLAAVEAQIQSFSQPAGVMPQSAGNTTTGGEVQP